MWGEVGGVELFQPAGIFFFTSTASTGFLFRVFFFSGVGGFYGGSQLDFSFETQQSFREHNSRFGNTTVFSKTQQNFPEH